MYQQSRRKLIIPFLFPAMVIYIIFLFIPIILTVYFSLTNLHGTSLELPFYGLRNYILIFKDPQIWGALKNTAIFAIFGSVITFIPALFFSWALTQKIKMKRIFRYIILSPLVLSTVVTSLLWKLLYNPVFGPINAFLKLIGLESLALSWLGDPRTVIFAIIVATTWQELGMWVLLISAGIERIPTEIMEAARIDGGNEWQIFWQITMPLLWGVLRLLFIVWAILSLQVFTQIFIMVGSTAGSASEVIATLIYKRAFDSRQWGLASGMATLLMILIFSVSMIMNKLTKRQAIEF